MSFSILTNVASLQAQNYLEQSNQLQTNTVAQVSSGLRITDSGVDAAGLAIANGYRSDEAVLTQGIQNANNGIGQLQIVDGGESNISQLLDRARTLATQSASGTFTGNRATLNDEFQSVLTEINREAQAIGLDQGGSLATNLQVFVGGGKASPGGSAATAVTNGIEDLNLSNATVDTKSLGLTGVQVLGGTTGVTDIGTGSDTSVQTIVTNSNNVTDATKQDGQSGYTDFIFNGPGFSNSNGSDQVKVQVNLAGVTDSNSLVAAINTALGAAGGAGNQQATAFKNANIVASTVTDSTGKTQLTFTSGSSAFQVTAGDATANALLGNFATGGGATVGQGASASSVLSGAIATSTTGATETGVTLKIQGAGITSAPTLTFNVTNGDSTATIAANINTQIAASGNASLINSGITAVAGTGGVLQFVGKSGQTFEAQVGGDTGNYLGLNSTYGTSGTTFAATAAQTTGDSQGLEISVNGGPTVDLGSLTAGGTEAASITTINTAIQASATLRQAGIVAQDDGTGNIKLVSTVAGVNFQVNTYAGTGGSPGDAFGFGTATQGLHIADGTGTLQSGYSTATTFDASGEYQSADSSADKNPFAFSGLKIAGDTQTVTVTALDASGAAHSLNVSLNSTNAGTLDDALQTINTQLQQSNDATLAGVVALKQVSNTGSPTSFTAGKEGVVFASANASFSVTLGVSKTGAGLADDGAAASSPQGEANPLQSYINGDAGSIDISNATSAANAVTALAGAVTSLGNAQAVVGRGENQFQYAATLAQSQLTNEQSAESQIRDANLAQASATLTKAQILLQAGVAALAQANSAPQQLLTLLKG